MAKTMQAMKTIERLALDYGRICIMWAIEDERAHRFAQQTHDFDQEKAEAMYESIRPSQKGKQAALEKLLDRIASSASVPATTPPEGPV